MHITIALFSILVIASFTWIINRIRTGRLHSPRVFTPCPICIGVSGTWLWILVASFLGYEIDLIIPAILMGGTVVGTLYQLEKRFVRAHSSPRKLLVWKILFVPIGFLAVYGVLSSWWIIVAVAVITLVLLTLLFNKKSRTSSVTTNNNVEKLEHEMENCC